MRYNEEIQWLILFFYIENDINENLQRGKTIVFRFEVIDSSKTKFLVVSLF